MRTQEAPSVTHHQSHIIIITSLPFYKMAPKKLDLRCVFAIGSQYLWRRVPTVPTVPTKTRPESSVDKFNLHFIYSAGTNWENGALGARSSTHSRAMCTFLSSRVARASPQGHDSPHSGQILTLPQHSSKSLVCICTVHPLPPFSVLILLSACPTLRLSKCRRV